MQLFYKLCSKNPQT